MKLYTYHNNHLTECCHLIGVVTSEQNFTKYVTNILLKRDQFSKLLMSKNGTKLTDYWTK